MKKLFLPVLAILASSCIGIKTEVFINANHSGTVRVEYTISEDAASLGTLPGNENSPIVPTGREDFERTAARIAGLSLASFSESKTAKGRVYTATLAFSNLDALCAYFDNGQGLVSRTQDGGKTTLSFTPPSKNDEEGTVFDADFDALVAQAFAGYNFDLKVTAGGGTKSLSVPMGQLLTTGSDEALVITF